jgi:hypothetical protein
MNQWKSYVLAAFGLVALTVVVVAFTAKPVLAQIKAALVSDVDNPARNFVRLRTDVAHPALTSSATICFETGYTVPVGKRLVIDDVSVQTSTSANSSTISGMFTELTVSAPGAQNPCSFNGIFQKRSIGVIPFTSTVLGALVFGGPFNRFSIAHERTQFYVESGETLAGNVVSTAGFSSEVAYEAYISGHLVTIP